MNSKIVVIAFAALATACHPRMRSAPPVTDRANIPESLQVSPAKMIPNGDARRTESARALLLALSETQDIEDHVLVKDLQTAEEIKYREQRWNDLPQEHKNVVAQLQAQCQISKKQTRPDLTTLTSTAQFHYGSDLHTEGAGCPAVLSRVSESQGQVISWNKETKNGSYRTNSSVKTVSEFQNPEHQRALGMSKGEFTMEYKADIERENGQKKRSFLRATGQGFMVLTANNLGRVDIEYKGRELHKDGLKTTVIELRATTGGETFSYAFQTDGPALERKLTKAYLGTAELNAEEIKNLKVEKLALKLSLSVN